MVHRILGKNSPSIIKNLLIPKFLMFGYILIWQLGLSGVRDFDITIKDTFGKRKLWKGVF